VGSEISDRNLVKGIFRELAVLGTPVHAETSKGSLVVHVQLIGDNTRNTLSQDMVAFHPPIEGESAINLSFELENKLFTCSLDSENLEGIFSFPQVLKPTQKRSSRRSLVDDLVDHPLIGELRAPGLCLYGRLKDSNGRFIVFATPAHSLNIKPNQKVQLRVYSSEEQTLLRNGTVSYVRDPTDGETEIVIDLQLTSNDTKVARLPRHNLPSNNRIRLTWPSEAGLKFDAMVIEASISGFAAALVDENCEMPPLGAICNISTMAVRARLAWRSGTQIGFDLRLNDSFASEKWIALLEEWTRPGLSKLSSTKQRRQLLKIMLRSGYLKGKRAQIFKAEALETLVPNNTDSRAWLVRFSRSISDDGPDVHISYLKLSDSSWMIQELGHMTNLADGTETISDSMSEFFLREQFQATLDTHLLAVYDNSSRFNQEYWDPKSEKGLAFFSKCVVCDLTALREDDQRRTNHSDFALCPADLSMWRDTFKNLLKTFDERILNGLGLKRDTFDAPVLRQHVSKSGYVFQRDVTIVTKNGEISAVAISFGLPTFANLSTAASQLWILMTEMNDAKQVLSAIFSHDHSFSPMWGATEAVIVPAKPEQPAIVDGLKCRSFTILSLPVLKIPLFLEVDK